jgi:hypothetical protein
MMHDNFPRILAITHVSLFVTLWEQKDWIPEVWRTLVWAVIATFCALGLLGCARRPQAAENATVALWPPVAAFAAMWLACIIMAIFFHYGWAEGGRYILPALGGLLLLVARGWGALAGAHVRLIAFAWSAFLLALNGIAIYWLLAFLNPTYGNR